VLVRLAVAAFLLAHAGIHAGFVSSRPAATAGGPPWPFDLGRSWALSNLGIDPEVGRLVGVALVALTFAGFALAALTSVGIVPAAIGPAAIVVGAVASIGVLSLFFHRWLVVGLAIDLALLWGVVAGSLPWR
jgi:hypothetical protein